MTRLLRVGLLAVATVLIAGAVTLAASPADAGRTSREAFRAEMRALWNDHVVWTRMFIVSAATQPDDLPDIGPTASRLFANQAHIGDAVAAFYGEAAGDELTSLLSDHIAIAAEAIAAAKSGNQAGLDGAVTRWYANADDIARFLADANPRHWHVDDLRAHMRHHLDLTLAEAVARLQGDFPADIAAYDQIRTQILDLADTLANGIIQQFPGRFGR